MGNIQNSRISDDYILTSVNEDMKIPDYNQNMTDFYMEKISKYLESHENKEYLINCGKRYFPQKTISDGPEAHTLKDFLHKVPAFAKSLYKKGLRKSDVVHLIIGNRGDIYIPVFATILCQGIVSISVDSISKDTLLSEVTETKARFVICSNQTLEKVKDVNCEIINMDTDFNDLIYEGASSNVSVPKQEAFDVKDVVVILWSSGTTGKPKGIPMTVISFLASLHNPPRGQGNMLVTSNFGHISGFFFALFWTIHFDIYTYHFISSDDVAHLGVEKIFDIVKEVPMFSMMLSSNHLIYMAEKIKNGEIEPSPKYKEVYFITPVGAQTYPTIGEDLGKLFTNLMCVANLYGLTESGGAILRSTSQKSNGGIVSMSEVYIRDLETGKRLGPNQRGELMFRRKYQITPGYINMQEENALTFEKDGWCHSGDLFYYTESGEFFFESRIKELIKCQGSHVYPIELETLIKGMNENIIEVGLVSVSDKNSMRLGAIIVLKKGTSIDVEGIRQELNEKVDSYKRMEGHLLTTYEPLPRNPIGKILRSDLKKEYHDLLSRQQ